LQTPRTRHSTSKQVDGGAQLAGISEMRRVWRSGEEEKRSPAHARIDPFISSTHPAPSRPSLKALAKNPSDEFVVLEPPLVEWGAVGVTPVSR